MFQKIFSESTLKLFGGLLLLKYHIEKLFISFLLTPRGSLLETFWAGFFGQFLQGSGGWVSSRLRWRDITALNHGQFTSVERKVVCKRYFMGPPREKEGVFSISFPSSKFSEMCLIFARCQIITLLVNHK